MLGPAIYGTTFGRALHFASTRLAKQEHDPVAIVRFVVMSHVAVASSRVCPCGCLVPYVDHLGQWKQSEAAIMIPNDSLPATRYMEVAVASPSNVQVMSYSVFSRTFAKYQANGPIAATINPGSFDSASETTYTSRSS